LEVSQHVDSRNGRRARWLTRQPSLDEVAALALCFLRLPSPWCHNSPQLRGAAATDNGATKSLGSQTEIRPPNNHLLDHIPDYEDIEMKTAPRPWPVPLSTSDLFFSVGASHDSMTILNRLVSPVKRGWVEQIKLMVRRPSVEVA